MYKEESPYPGTDRWSTDLNDAPDAIHPVVAHFRRRDCSA